MKSIEGKEELENFVSYLFDTEVEEDNSVKLKLSNEEDFKVYFTDEDTPVFVSSGCDCDGTFGFYMSTIVEAFNSAIYVNLDQNEVYIRKIEYGSEKITNAVNPQITDRVYCKIYYVQKEATAYEEDFQ